MSYTEKLQELLNSNHIEIPYEKENIELLELFELRRYPVYRKIIFYKYGGVYQWALANDDSDWLDIMEYGAQEDIRDQISEENAQFLYEFGNITVNNW